MLYLFGISFVIIIILISLMPAPKGCRFKHTYKEKKILSAGAGYTVIYKCSRCGKKTSYKENMWG